MIFVLTILTTRWNESILAASDGICLVSLPKWLVGVAARPPAQALPNSTIH